MGFTYDMAVEFHSIFVHKDAGEIKVSDLTASVNIHRIKLNFGPTGYHTTVLSRKGRPDYTIDFESSNNHTFNRNQYNILLDTESTIPIYARNRDIRIKLLATHPTPCTFYSQTWEGDYNPNYYRRA